MRFRWPSWWATEDTVCHNMAAWCLVLVLVFSQSMCASLSTVAEEQEGRQVPGLCDGRPFCPSKR